MPSAETVRVLEEQDRAVWREVFPCGACHGGGLCSLRGDGAGRNRSDAVSGTITEKSQRLLEERYLATGSDGQKETINGLFKRVSGGDEAYEKLMASLDFLPNSPALFNYGTGKRGTVFACYRFSVADSMLDGPSSIMATAKKAAIVAKWGGGVGYYLGRLRPKNSLINTVHRRACGPVGVLKYYNALEGLITQGGKRALAQMGILPAWHDDIHEFINVKNDNPKDIHSFNISVSWTDGELKEIEEGRPGRALNVWNEQVNSAWRTGDPGVYFFDTIERYNPTPWLGKLEGSNPCGEAVLLENEPCDLGSMNLVKFITKNRTVDYTRLYERSRLAQKYLDHLHDVNEIDIPEVMTAARKTRKTGLGVMGWADALCLLHVHYDSEEALGLADKVMSCINQAGYDESIDLAKKHGPYPGYRIDHATTPPVRNATRTVIAPTGSIYLIAGLDGSGIEPHFALSWERKTNEGMILEEKVNAIEASEGFVPRVSTEIATEWHIRHQAVFQKHTDQAISKTINLPNNATKKDVANAYLLMWKLGCKGGTIFREGCRTDSVLKAPGGHSEGKGYDAVIVPVKECKGCEGGNCPAF